MQNWFEGAVKMFLEGGLKAKALTVGLKALDGIRKLFIVHQIFTMVCLLCTMSAFAGGFVLFNHEAPLEIRALPAVFIYCVVVFLISALILWYTARSRTWVSALGLKQRLDSQSQRSTTPTSVDAQELATLIEQIIEKKLEAKTNTPPSQNSDK